MLHINSRGQPGAARSSEKQYTKLVSALEGPLEPRYNCVYIQMKVSQRNHEESCLTVMMSPPYTQQQPADISDERQPFTSSLLTMTGWSRLQPETAYPTFPSHTQEPAKGPRGAAKTRGKEAQH
ncbi:hypothetical protein QJQ45_023615 [Haematococcus lacustris]|nr:hypothetical protein QJQ45_023615 [Haematococcus lacustris]